MKLYVSIFFTFHFAICEAQNLVPNSSFEDTLNNPNWNSPLIQDNCTYWYGPSPGTTDYFNDLNPLCPGCISAFTHVAKTGFAFAGIYTFVSDSSLNEDYREMLCVKLNDTLQSGRKYQLVFYVARAWFFNYSCNNIGAYFSETPQTNSNMTTTLPHIENDPNSQSLDTVEWVRIAGLYTASGSELYLTIGNFNNNSSSDTSYMGGGVSNQLISYYFVDDVSLTPFVEPIDTTYEFVLYPNPSDGNFWITTNFPLETRFVAYNLLGQPVCDPIGLSEGNSHFPIMLDVAMGIYYYRIEADGIVLKEGKLEICE